MFAPANGNVSRLVSSLGYWLEVFFNRKISLVVVLTFVEIKFDYY